MKNNLSNPSVELKKKQAIVILRTAPVRAACSTWYAKEQKTKLDLEILHNGRWLYLARTDLMDDEQTILGEESVEGKEEATRQLFISMCEFGARIDDECFAVIDSISDG